MGKKIKTEFYCRCGDPKPQSVVFEQPGFCEKAKVLHRCAVCLSEFMLSYWRVKQASLPANKNKVNCSVRALRITPKLIEVLRAEAQTQSKKRHATEEEIEEMSASHVSPDATESV